MGFEDEDVGGKFTNVFRLRGDGDGGRGGEKNKKK